MQAAGSAEGARERFLYEVHMQAASPAVRASKRSCALPLAAQLYANGGRTKRTRTSLGKCRQGGCRRLSSAHAFLQALAFMQQSMGEPPPVALSALLRIHAGGYSQASHAAASWVAALWGLLRTAAVEHPNVRWTALSVDALAPHADTVQARHSEHQAALTCLLDLQSVTAGYCWDRVAVYCSKGPGINIL